MYQSFHLSWTLIFLWNYYRPMIVKPPNWFCGIGIKLINKIGEQRLSTSESFALIYHVTGLRGDTEQEEQDVRAGVH